MDMMKFKKLVKRVEEMILPLTVIKHNQKVDTSNLKAIHDILYWEDINVKQLSFDTFHEISKLQIYCDLFYSDLSFIETDEEKMEIIIKNDDLMDITCIFEYV